jgi:murein DD-endopeptidase MepM/ murein hydrolase activator NlpD
VPVDEPLVAAAPLAATSAVADVDASPAPAATTAPLSRRARRVTVDAPQSTAPADEQRDAETASALLADTLAAFAAAGAAAPSEVAVPGRASRRRTQTRPVETPVVDEVEELTVVTATPEARDAHAEAADPEPDESAAEAPSDASVDEFELAARLFSFTGETPVQESAPTEAPAQDAAASTAAQRHVAPRRAKANAGSSFRRVATASFSMGVIGIVGLMAVGMTTPAEAVAAAGGADTTMSVVAPADGKVTTIDKDEIQAYVAPAGVESDNLERTENYGTTTTAELASEAGIKNFSNLFHNDPNAPIQWPFAVGVTMSYGFGMRDGRMHEGIDFTPGAGSPIQAIADGTVRVASEAGGAYGVHVIIDHMIDGQLVSSHYAHMQYGSLQVKPGQHVTVGTMLGRTGNTGRSYGAHTHFEILMNGTTAIDPMPWLREHAGG